MLSITKIITVECTVVSVYFDRSNGQAVGTSHPFQSARGRDMSQIKVADVPDKQSALRFSDAFYAGIPDIAQMEIEDTADGQALFTLKFNKSYQN